jgi:hypothetical protein
MSDVDDSGRPHKKVYARGYFDGLRAAGIETSGMSIIRSGMTESKFNSLFSGLTSIARKVYECVPISAPWTASQIYSEIKRQGSSLDIKSIAGCLCSLVNQGLVLERKKGEFIRASVKKKIESTTIPTISVKAPTTIESKSTNSMEINMDVKVSANKKDPINKLGDISTRALQISADLKSLANDIENTALEIAEHMSSRDAENAKLKQLQQLLKSLGVGD